MIERADPARQPSTVGTAVFLLWGLVVWGLQFSAVYIGHTLVCALGGSGTALLVAALTALALVLIAPVVVAPARAGALVGLDPGSGDHAHLFAIARAIAALSFLAALWTGLTVVLVGECALAR